MSGDLLCVPSRGILYPFSLQQSIPSVAFEVIFGGNRSDHMIFECVSLEFWSKGLPHSIGSRTYPPYEAFVFLSLLRGFLYLDCPDLVIELHYVVGHGLIAAINGRPVGVVCLCASSNHGFSTTPINYRLRSHGQQLRRNALGTGAKSHISQNSIVA